MPNQGVPVIFKNKIAYGYAEKSVQAYDVSVSDYNALTEQQQLDGSIRFIQGVDAIPNGSNVWAKLGTTPLAEGLPRDCSQAVNQLKSNLTELEEYSETEQVVGKWTDGKTLYRKVYTCPSFSVTSSSTAQTYTVFTFPSNTNIIKYFCVLNHSISEYMLPYSNGNKTSSCVGIKGTTPYIQIRVTNDGWTGVTVTTEAYYTKNS